MSRLVNDLLVLGPRRRTSPTQTSICQRVRYPGRSNRSNNVKPICLLPSFILSFLLFSAILSSMILSFLIPPFPFFPPFFLYLYLLHSFLLHVSPSFHLFYLLLLTSFFPFCPSPFVSLLILPFVIFPFSLIFFTPSPALQSFLFVSFVHPTFHFSFFPSSTPNCFHPIFFHLYFSLLSIFSSFLCSSFLLLLFPLQTQLVAQVTMSSYSHNKTSALFQV